MKMVTRSLEQAMGKLASRRGEQVLGGLSLIALVVSAVMSLVIAPPDAVQGNVQRLMYVHVPAAWIAYAAFTTVFVASVMFLITKRAHWDAVAASAAELGVLFTALTIVLGSIWGYPVWGTWWSWDPRLTTTAVMLLIYAGYLSIRRIPESAARRARWSAVVGIVGFADVPIVHMSVVWWRSLHQQATVLQPGSPTIAPVMLAALLIGLAAFSFLFAHMLVLRMRVGRLEAKAVGATLVHARSQAPAVDAAAEAAQLEALING